MAPSAKWVFCAFCQLPNTSSTVNSFTFVKLLANFAAIA
jgi:hypothetical protein